MQRIWSRIKPYCRWVALGGALLFLAKAIKEHASKTVGIKIDTTGWAVLAIALGVTMLAHIWSSWVWTWILRELNQPVTGFKLIQAYLQTNIAKYIPGSFWHYYGRIVAAKTAGIAASAAALSVLLEPLLMAAAALTSVLLASLLVGTNNYITLQGLAIFGLIAVLIAVHPRFLNVAVHSLGGSKATTDSNTLHRETLRVKQYPLRPLLGELGFLGLRSTGFLLTLLAFNCLELSQMPLLVAAFNLSWLLGLIVPTPGGLGVFEATAIALLEHHLAPGRLLSAIALYRLISILAEAACAGLAWLDERRGIGRGG